jgi:hypothetical protein
MKISNIKDADGNVIVKGPVDVVVREIRYHSGAPRTYFCGVMFDENGELYRTADGMIDNLRCTAYSRDGIFQYGRAILKDGAAIPWCDVHNVEAKKPKNPTIADRNLDSFAKAKLTIEDMRMWAEPNTRKTTQCVACYQPIAKGDMRIAFDFGKLIGRGRQRRRRYVHQTCFIETVLIGGKAGLGCPGCSAKLALEEFASYKKLLKKQYDASR